MSDVQTKKRFQNLTIEELSSIFLKSKFWNLYLESTSLEFAFRKFLESINLILTIDNGFLKSLRKAIAKNLEAESYACFDSVNP